MPSNQSPPSHSLPRWLPQAFFESALLVAAIYLAAALRALLPFGDPLPAPVEIPPILVLSVVLAWIALAWQLPPETPDGYPSAKIRLLVLYLAALTLLEFGVLWLHNSMTLSRLLIPYLFIVNFGLLAAARLLLPRLAACPRLPNALHALKEAAVKLGAWAHDHYLDMLLAFASGLTWAGFILRMGLKITTDSAIYLRTAMALHFDAGALPIAPAWPPFYPMTLSWLLPLSPFPADVAALLSAAVFVATLVVFSSLLRQISNYFWLNSLILVSLASFRGFFYIFEAAWSEQLFTLLLLLNIYFLLQHKKTGHSISFWLASLFWGLAMATRYAGLFGLLPMLAYAWLDIKDNRGWRRVLRDYAFPLAIAFLPLSAWLARNWISLGTLLGERVSSVFSGWDTPLTVFRILAQDLSLPLLALAATLVVFYWRTRSSKKGAIASDFRVWNLWFFLSYVVFILFASSFSYIDLESRILAPAYPYFFLLLASLLAGLKRDEMVKTLRGLRLSAFIAPLIILVLLLNLANQLLGVENVLVDRPRTRSQTATAHTESGFDLSPTSEGFRRFLSTQFASQSTVTTFVLLDDSNFFAPALFMKSGAIQNSGYENFALGKYRRESYSLVFDAAGDAKSLTWLALPYSVSPTFLADALSQGLEIPPEGNWLAVVNEGWLAEAGLAAGDLRWPPGAALTDSAHVPPYWLFALQSNSAP